MGMNGLSIKEAKTNFIKKTSKEIATIMYQVANERGVLVV